MVNEKFKNSVFTTLFNDPALLRELYCALEGVSLPPDAPVSINTLENVLFMEQNNDISFEIDGKLVVLIEHQSTINPNMALRLLMYIGRVYEKIVEGSGKYSSKLLPIPRPEFFVLYNGTAPFPDEKTIRLSGTFKKTESLGLSEKEPPALELTVRVININEGKNEAIVKRCKKLSEYSAFVAKTRAFQEELGDMEEAVKETIKYCQKHDIMKEFLETHAKEVFNMLTSEWNLDDAIAYRSKEIREDSLAQGRDEGREEGIEECQLAIARNLLTEGFTPEFIQKVTWLSLDSLKEMQADL